MARLYNTHNTVAVQRAGGMSSPREDLLQKVAAGWDSTLDAYLAALDVNSNATKRTYKKALNSFHRWVEETGRQMSRLAREDVLEYKDYLFSEKNRHSPHTVNAYLAALRSFYTWAESEMLYPNIAAGIKRAKAQEEFIKMHLTHDEINKLLTAFMTGDGLEKRKIAFGRVEQISLRNFAIINLMVRCGLRTIEVSRLDVGDIQTVHSRRVLLVWGKGRDSKDDRVPLDREAYEPIWDYLQTRPDATKDDPLFIAESYDRQGTRLCTRQIQRICKAGLKAIGLDSHAYSAHSLRHTTAVEILLNGGDMWDVKYMLRHTDPRTSELYVKSIEKEERLRHSPDRYLHGQYVTKENPTPDNKTEPQR